MNSRPIPEVGKKYNCYDDGKIKPSRHCVAEILEIIPMNEIWEKLDPEKIIEITEAPERYDWLFEPKTDFVVKAKMSGTCYNSDDPIYYFIPSKGGWFSTDDYWGARLDMDNSLTNDLIDYMKEDYSEKDYKETIKIFV